MSNADIARSIYDAFAKGDVPTILGAMDEKIEWTEPEFATFESQVGPAAVAENIFGKVIADFPNFSATPNEILDAGDVVVALGQYRGNSAATGGELDIGFAHVWRFKDGKIVGFRTYNDSLGWLKAMGKA